MTGKRIAIFGLGRSGISVGKAALSLGAVPKVYDEQTADNLAKKEILVEAQDIGLDVELGWKGQFAEAAPDLIVANPAIPKTHPRLVAALAAGLKVISEVEFAYLISKAPIIAITGTNGKSTTTVMTYLVLKACGEEPVLCGNIFGSGYDEQPLTEAALNSTPHQILVAEISSFQLEWVDQFQPVSAAITNIEEDHLDRYESFQEYANTKKRIFARQTADNFAVVQEADREFVQGSTARVLSFDGQATDLETFKILSTVLEKTDFPFSEPHNFRNASMAALLVYGVLNWKAVRDSNSNAARILAGAGPDSLPREISEGLKQFRPLAHRMEWLGVKHGIRVNNNSMCTNPDAVVNSAIATGATCHLLVGGVNKNSDFAPLKSYLAGNPHQVYLYGRDALSINGELGDIWPVFETMAESFHEATAKASNGEVIMLAPGCASTDQFRDFRHRGDVFKELAKEWLET